MCWLSSHAKASELKGIETPLQTFQRVCFHELGHLLALIGSNADVTPTAVSVIPSASTPHPHVTLEDSETMKQEGVTLKDIADRLAFYKGGKVMEDLVFGKHYAPGLVIDERESAWTIRHMREVLEARAPQNLPAFEAMLPQDEAYCRSVIEQFDYDTLCQMALQLAKDEVWGPDRIRQMVAHFQLRERVMENQLKAATSSSL